MFIGIGITIAGAGQAGEAIPRIQLSGLSIAETGGSVGTISVANSPDGVTWTFAITADPDSKFSIENDDELVADDLDYETATSHSVTIEATPSEGDPISRTFTIQVTDVEPEIFAAGMGIDFSRPWSMPPTNAELDFLHGQGVGLVRIHTAWERWQPTLGTALESGYLAAMLDLFDRLAARDMKGIIDLHNYGKYDPNYDPPEGSPPGVYDHGNPGGGFSGVSGGYILGDGNLTTAHLVDVWERIATAFKDHSALAAYGIMNEPNSMIGTNIILQANGLGGDHWYTESLIVSALDDAWRLESTGGFGFIAQDVPNIAGSTQYTLSFDAWTIEGTAGIEVRIGWGNAVGEETVTETPQRFTHTVTTGAGGTETVTLALPAMGRTIVVSNVQLELGGTATEYETNPWVPVAQAVVDAVREIDMAAPVLVSGYGLHGSGAGDWLFDNPQTIVTDPADTLIYEAHLYYDALGGGSYPDDYDTDGASLARAERIQPFLDWLDVLGVKGIIGETGIPWDDDRWQAILAAAMTDADEAGVPVFYHWFGTTRDGEPEWWPPTTPASLNLAQAGEDGDPIWAILQQYPADSVIASDPVP